MDALVHTLERMGLRPTGHAPEPCDFASDDGEVVLDFRRAQGGTRDLHAATLQLAMHTPPEVRRAVLLVAGARMSPQGIRDGWDAVRRVLAPEIAARLSLVALLGGQIVTVPETDLFLRELGGRASRALDGNAPTPRADRSFEVLRVLLSRWLRRQGPITVKQLQAQTGLSYPSVSKAIAALEGAVERRRDRSVALCAFPSAGWNLLLASAVKVRQTLAFVDASGRGADPGRLLERVRRVCPERVAVAGVPAARHWHPGLDLHGAPRLDLSVHVQEGPMDTSFLQSIDPALVAAPRGAPPLLVLHAVHRADSLFAPGVGVPWADPVEALLDLHELRLIEQANELIHAMRSAS